MSYEQKPRIAIFANEKAGQAIVKNDGSFVTNSSGEVITHADYTGKITIPADLAAGEYEVSIYNSVAKSGKSYMSGTIKPAFKKKVIDQHSKAKGNGFVRQVDEDDSKIPF